MYNMGKMAQAICVLLLQKSGWYIVKAVRINLEGIHLLGLHDI